MTVLLDPLLAHVVETMCSSPDICCPDKCWWKYVEYDYSPNKQLPHFYMGGDFALHTLISFSQSVWTCLKYRNIKLRLQQRSLVESHPESNPPMLGGTRCQLIFNQSAISSHICNSLVDIRSTQALKQRIQAQMRVTSTVSDEVDWVAHDLAGNDCKHVPEVFLTKCLHKILPVDKRLLQYDKDVLEGLYE
jgi:hypothetical protein